MEIVISALLYFVIFVVLIAALSSFYTVQTAQVAIITRFGQFLQTFGPGLGWKLPFIDKLEGRVSLRVDQIELTMETSSTGLTSLLRTAAASRTARASPTSAAPSSRACPTPSKASRNRWARSPRKMPCNLCW